MDSLSSAEQDSTKEGPIPVEKKNDLLKQGDTDQQQSTQEDSKKGLEAKSLATSFSTLSVSAEPFMSTSSEKSSGTQLSVFAKEFVPKSIPSTSLYTEPYQAYGVYNSYTYVVK